MILKEKRQPRVHYLLACLEVAARKPLH